MRFVDKFELVARIIITVAWLLIFWIMLSPFVFAQGNNPEYTQRIESNLIIKGTAAISTTIHAQTIDASTAQTDVISATGARAITFKATDGTVILDMLNEFAADTGIIRLASPVVRGATINVVSPADGDVLEYDTATGTWVNSATNVGGGITGVSVEAGTQTLSATSNLAFQGGGKVGVTIDGPTVTIYSIGSDDGGAGGSVTVTAATDVSVATTVVGIRGDGSTIGVSLDANDNAVIYRLGSDDTGAGAGSDTRAHTITVAPPGARNSTQYDIDLTGDPTPMATVNTAISTMTAASGCIVIFGEGTIGCEAPLQIATNNITIKGAGVGVTVFKRHFNDGGGNDGVIQVEGSTLTGINLMDFTVDGNKSVYTTASNDGIILQSVSFARVTNVESKNNKRHGIFLVSVANGTIMNNCILRSNDADGLNGVNSSDMKISDMYCYANGSDGISLDGNCWWTIISGGQFQDQTAGYGITMTGSFGSVTGAKLQDNLYGTSGGNSVEFSECFYYSNNSYGAHVISTATVVKNCYFLSNTTYGVFVAILVDDVTILGNTFIGESTAIGAFNGIDRLRVMNNIFDDCAIGVYTHGSNFPAIIGNHFYSNSTYGIQFGSTGNQYVYDGVIANNYFHDPQGSACIALSAAQDTVLSGNTYIGPVGETATPVLIDDYDFGIDSTAVASGEVMAGSWTNGYSNQVAGQPFDVQVAGLLISGGNAQRDANQYIVYDGKGAGPQIMTATFETFVKSGNEEATGESIRTGTEWIKATGIAAAATSTVLQIGDDEHGTTVGSGAGIGFVDFGGSPRSWVGSSTIGAGNFGFKIMNWDNANQMVDRIRINENGLIELLGDNVVVDATSPQVTGLTVLNNIHAGGTVSQASSRKYKENIRDITDTEAALENVSNASFIAFQWPKNPKFEQLKTPAEFTDIILYATDVIEHLILDATGEIIGSTFEEVVTATLVKSATEQANDYNKIVQVETLNNSIQRYGIDINSPGVPEWLYTYGLDAEGAIERKMDIGGSVGGLLHLARKFQKQNIALRDRVSTLESQIQQAQTAYQNLAARVAALEAFH